MYQMARASSTLVYAVTRGFDSICGGTRHSAWLTQLRVRWNSFAEGHFAALSGHVELADALSMGS